MFSGNSMVNRRSFLRTSGLAASVALLSSCARGSNSGGAAAPNTITSAGWDDKLTTLLSGPIAQAFHAKSGVALQAQAAVPFADYQTRFRTLLAGGSPPDVMRLNDDFLPEVSQKQLSKDLAPYFTRTNVDTADYFPIFEWARLPSGHRGLVIATQIRCIYYNKTMFEREGVPLPPTNWTPDGWTWDDFLETAKALTKGDQYGAAIVHDPGYEDMWARNNGGSGMFSDDGTRLALADPQGAEAIQFAADLTVKHHVQPQWGDLKPTDSSKRLFAAGKLAMMQHTSGTIGYYTQNVKDFEWDVAPVPARVNQYQNGSVVLYIIPDKAANPDQAWDYLNFAIGEEAGRMIAEAGLAVPVNKKAAQSLKSPGEYPKNIALLPQAAEHNKLLNFANNSSAAISLYRPQLERVYAGEVTAQQVLTDMRPQVEAALAAS
jgi:multiple sugar transport system substrate-binding protein